MRGKDTTTVFIFILRSSCIIFLFYFFSGFFYLLFYGFSGFALLSLLSLFSFHSDFHFFPSSFFFFPIQSYLGSGNGYNDPYLHHHILLTFLISMASWLPNLNMERSIFLLPLLFLHFGLVLSVSFVFSYSWTSLHL